MAVSLVQTIDQVLNNTGHIITTTFTSVQVGDIITIATAYPGSVTAMTPDSHFTQLGMWTSLTNNMVFYVYTYFATSTTATFTWTWAVSFAGKAEIVATQIRGSAGIAYTNVNIAAGGPSTYVGPTGASLSSSYLISYVGDYNNTAATTYSALNGSWVAGSQSTQTKYGVYSFNNPTPSNGSNQLTATRSQNYDYTGVQVSYNLTGGGSPISGLNGQELNGPYFNGMGRFTGFLGR